jgi:hypothetical protein
VPFALTRKRLDEPPSYGEPRWNTIRPFAPGNALSAGEAPPTAAAASATNASAAALPIILNPLVDVTS